MKVSGTEEALGLRLRLQGVGTVPWRWSFRKNSGVCYVRYLKGLPKPWITAGRYSIHFHEGNPIFEGPRDVYLFLHLRKKHAKHARMHGTLHDFT